ncbi:fractalkine [Artibeus jamaicensis]|uniref:fractalkine n=1 Tax=Artibeus jamaicensis TaxID=9417 RepID=UPI00235A6B95|nr:fractalkine [Artibeus jamaicensis]
MASPLSWLLRVAALCSLIVPLAGQHHGVSKCNITCKDMTSKIPEKLLVSYQRNQASCGKPAIILKTKKNRTFCADPEEEWVRKAMENLDRRAAAAVENHGVFEKRTGDEPTTTLASGDMDKSAGSEPRATGESSIRETQTALGTSPELPTGLGGSLGTRSPSTSKAPVGGPSAELFSTTAVTRAWWSSSAHQPGSDLWTEGEASEVPSTQATSTQTSSTQAPSTQTLPTQAPSTQTLPTQAPSTQTLPTQVPSTQAPSTQAPSTQAPSTQSPTLSRRAPEDNTGSEGPSMQISTQDPTSEGSLGPTDASTGAPWDTGSVPHVSTVLTPSEEALPRMPGTSSSGGLTAKSVLNPQEATRRQAVGLLAFLGLLFGLGVAMFAYQSLQGCPRNVAGDMVEGLRHVPRSCGSNSYVLVPV